MEQCDNDDKEAVEMPLAREAVALNATLQGLAETALRVKAERDEAIKLLRETLFIREMGSTGPHKTAIREFLGRISA